MAQKIVVLKKAVEAKEIAVKTACCPSSAAPTR